MPDLNVMIGVLPLWAVALLLIFLIAVCVMALRRSGSPGSIAALFGVPALIVIAWAAWTLADGAMIRQRTAEREALNARALQLITAATTSGSALACLDGGAGDAVEAACEAALFAKPETVAAATAYVEARLRLLADSLDYARRADWTFAATWAQLRSGLEADRYGFVAHVLAKRDGCTVESCSAFALLRDASTVKTHLSERTLDNNVARYAANWGRPGSAPVAAAPPTVGLAPPLPSGAATLLGVPVTRPIDFPSAASIPPVSIMTEPPAPAPAPAPAPKPGALSGRPQ